MRTSENIDLLYAAFILAQAEFPAVEKNKRSQFGKHATVDSVLAAALPILAKFGLGLTQPISNSPDGGVTIITRLIHKSGQWQEEPFTVKPDKPNIQGVGSAITYGRRYAAKAMLGLSDEDDDGQAAMPVKEDKPKAPPQQVYPNAKNVTPPQQQIPAAPNPNRLPTDVELIKFRELFLRLEVDKVKFAVTEKNLVDYFRKPLKECTQAELIKLYNDFKEGKKTYDGFLEHIAERDIDDVFAR